MPMKKFLSVIGASMLLGMSATAAVPTNFKLATLDSGESNNALVSFFSSELDDWSSLYSHVEIEGSELTGSIDTNSDFEADEYGDILFTYTPSISLNFVPDEGYLISSIMIVDLYQDITESEYVNVAEPSGNPEGVWSVTLFEGISEDIQIFISVEPADGSSGSPSDEPHNAIISVYSSDDEWEPETGLYSSYVDITVEPLSGSLDSDMETDKYGDISFTYTPAIALNLDPQNGYLISSIMIVDLDGDITESEYVNLVPPPGKPDGTWGLTLLNGIAEDISIYIDVIPADSSVTPPPAGDEKSVTLKVIEGDYELITGYTGNFTGRLKMTSESETFTYTGSYSFLISSMDPDYYLDIKCADSSLTDGVDYSLRKVEEDNDLYWYLDLDQNTPDDITFYISLSEPVVTPTITLNFTGEGVVSGLSISYEDFNNSANDFTTGIYKSPYSFDIPADAYAFFRLVAEGYIINITPALMPEANSQYFFISDNAVEVYPRNVNLTFDVNVTKSLGETSVTFKFEGAYTEGLVTVADGIKEQYLDVVDGAVEYSYTDSGYLVFEVKESGNEEYLLSFSCEGIEEGPSTFEVYNPGGLPKYYVDVFTGVAGKTITVTVDKFTGVSSISLDKDAVIYNLQGVRINKNDKLTKGLYIINGKKVYVK